MRKDRPKPCRPAIAFAGALVLVAIPTRPRAHPRRAPLVIAFVEQSIGPADLTPTPTATPGAPGEGSATPTSTPSATPTEPPIFAEPTPVPTSTADLAPLDIGTITPTQDVSDSSLDAAITAETPPARAASMRVAEEARKALAAGDADTAIRTLGRAVGIDPADPYAYFFLGRAYLAKKNFDEAMSFFKRAEIGFGSGNPAWLGETLAFEGLTYEQSDHLSAAVAAYQQAIAADPGNLMARVGYTRVLPEITPVAPASAPSGSTITSAPAAAQAPPAPAEASPPPPPGENAEPQN